MAVTRRIDKHLVWLESDEQATFDEWIGALNEAAAQPEWHPGMCVIHDARRMARVPSQAEAESRGPFVSRRTRALGIERWAAVVSTAGAPEGALQLAALFADREAGWCRVFTDFAEAEAWARREAQV